MIIEFKDLGNIESFYGNFTEPEGYGAFDDAQNEDNIVNENEEESAD